MAYNRSMVFVLTVLLCLAAAPAFASEELFDTATASKHMEQGISCLIAKDFDAAINAFDEAAAIAPEAEAFYYLGYAYYMKNRKNNGKSRKMSLENFEKAYEIDPNFSPTRYRVPEPVPQLISELPATEDPASPQLEAESDEMQPEAEPDEMQPVAEPDEMQPEAEPDEMQPEAEPDEMQPVAEPDEMQPEVPAPTPEQPTPEE